MQSGEEVVLGATVLPGQTPAETGVGHGSLEIQAEAAAPETPPDHSAVGLRGGLRGIHP